MLNTFVAMLINRALTSYKRRKYRTKCRTSMCGTWCGGASSYAYVYCLPVVEYPYLNVVSLHQITDGGLEALSGSQRDRPQLQAALDQTRTARFMTTRRLHR